jgi:rod shape-determining protein MreB
MIGRMPSELIIRYPLRDGAIADYRATEIILNYFINKAIGPLQFFKPDVVISVPAGISSSEKRAITDATLRIGAKNVYLVKEPLLAAIGAGIKTNQPASSGIVSWFNRCICIS